MTHKPTTDNIADDEFETPSADDTWPAELTDEEPDLSTSCPEMPPRQHSALRNIEERRERERLRRELEDFAFESDRRREPD